MNRHVARDELRIFVGDMIITASNSLLAEALEELLDVNEFRLKFYDSGLDTKYEHLKRFVKWNSTRHNMFFECVQFQLSRGC